MIGVFTEMARATSSPVFIFLLGRSSVIFTNPRKTFNLPICHYPKLHPTLVVSGRTFAPHQDGAGAALSRIPPFFWTGDRRFSKRTVQPAMGRCSTWILMCQYSCFKRSSATGNYTFSCLRSTSFTQTHPARAYFHSGSDTRQIKFL